MIGAARLAGARAGDAFGEGSRTSSILSKRIPVHGGDPVSHTAVLVVSCDKYASAWPAFFHGLRKYWRDCPFPVYLLANRLTTDTPGVTTLTIGRDRGWSSNLLWALDKIGKPVILMLQEDHWILAPVPTPIIVEYARLVANDQADYIRLNPSPPPDFDSSLHPRLGTLATAAPYRVGCQVPMWNRTVFEHLLRPGEDAWQFELRGTERSRIYGDRFLCVKNFTDGSGQRTFSGVHTLERTAIVKGEWHPSAFEYARREGITVDWKALDRALRWDRFARTPIGRQLCRVLRVVRHPGYLIEYVRRRTGG